MGSWICPFCAHACTVRYDDDIVSGSVIMLLENREGPREAVVNFTVCPNPACKRFALSVGLYKYDPQSDRTGLPPQVRGELLQYWRLVPESDAKVYPDYVPQAIRDDYTEACLIRDKSPKASATLARRCLQGMIRDFWGVQKDRLIDEIEAIRDNVEAETWKGIDAVRDIGNIGAHMEKDVNLIIDVEPGEASHLIRLIEMLLRDWYITRHERKESLRAILDIAQTKRAKRNGASSTGGKA